MSTQSPDFRNSAPSSTGRSTDAHSTSQDASGASKVIDQAQEKVGQAAQQAQEKMAPLMDTAQEKVSQAAEMAKEQATTRLGGQKEQAAESLKSVAQAVRQTGDELRSHDQATFAQFTDQAAQKIEHFSTYLQQHDMDAIVDDVESFARRSPTMFLGGAMALGLLAARFFKSSARRTRTSGQRWGGYQGGYQGGYAGRGLQGSQYRYDTQQFSGGQPWSGQGQYGQYGQYGPGQYEAGHTPPTHTGTAGQSSYGGSPASGTPGTGARQSSTTGQAPYSSQQPGGEQAPYGNAEKRTSESYGAGQHVQPGSGGQALPASGTQRTGQSFDLRDEDRSPTSEGTRHSEGSTESSSRPSTAAPAHRNPEGR